MALVMERQAIYVARSKIQHRGISSKTIDLLEVCAGRAVITKRAVHYGLRAGQPIDVLYGWDLLAPGEDKQFLRYVDQAKPRLTICESLYGLVILQRRDQLQAPSG